MKTLTAPVPIAANPISVHSDAVHCETTVEAFPPQVTGASRSATASMQAASTLQVLAEEFSVTKETVATGRVHVTTRTRNHDVFIDETLARYSVEISTIPMGQFVDASPRVRMEGDVTIVPVVEEVLVVERRLRLKEELRITPIRIAEHHRQRVTLRRQEAIITRDQVNGLWANIGA